MLARTRDSADQEREPGPTFKLEDICFCDFETRSAVSLKTAGAYAYATQADAIVLAYAIGSAPAATVAVGDFSSPLVWDRLPADLRAHAARVAAGEAIYAAWNAGFDAAIWNYATIGFPLLLPHHIIDVMAQATASGLPPDLAGAATACGAGVEKDKAGTALIKLFCLMESASTPASHPEQWRQLLAYARTDVEAMRAVFLGTRQLPLAEWREYWAMEAVNARGIGIDVRMAEHAAKLADEDRDRSRDRLAVLTKGVVTSVNQVARLGEWLKTRLPAEGRMILAEKSSDDEEEDLFEDEKSTLTRAQVGRLIALLQSEPWRDDASLRGVLEVLQIRLYGGSRTPAKFAKMLMQQVDGTLYGQYVFNGAAQTGRASSKGAQLQNLARDALKHEQEAIDALLAGCSYDGLAACNPDPVARQLSLLIRPALVPHGTNLFVWSDWSQIEARILPWLAGDEKRLQIFRDTDANPSHTDLYMRTAVQLARGGPPVRQTGKIAELSLGFGGGVGALQRMAANYGLHIPDDEARNIVERWRHANAWCVEFWSSLADAATGAMRLPGVPHPAGRLVYIYLGGYLGGSLLCQLPSGRCLTYRGVSWDRVKETDQYGAEHETRQLRFSRGHGRVKLWKGMMAEGATQAVAADFLRGTLRRLEDEGFRTRLHSHDEILVEAPEDCAQTTAQRLREVMRRGFDWGEGLPLMSAETIAPYYTKCGG